jgi:hypothetical protein
MNSGPSSNDQSISAPAERHLDVVDEHGSFARRMRDLGKYVAGAGLNASSKATVVRPAPDGTDAIVVDGPFIESKEQIGGFYLLECVDLDEALQIAREIPRSTGLAIEVRPAPH